MKGIETILLLNFINDPSLKVGLSKSFIKITLRDEPIAHSKALFSRQSHSYITVMGKY